MDLSALIFVALAAAWGAYLIPKSLRHHADDERSRTVDSFSGSMRVLARREPVDARRTQLVAESPPKPDRHQLERRRAATAKAARRRRRVLLLLLLANVTVGGLVALEIVLLPYLAIPAGLLLAWLVVCRLTVRAERRRPVSTVVGRPEVEEVAQQPSRDRRADDLAGDDDTTEVPVVDAVTAAPATWEPVPVTLPTYVDKETARRSVRTIDLDSTGVWTSGRSAADAELARQADQAEPEPPAADETSRRVSGA